MTEDPKLAKQFEGKKTKNKEISLHKKNEILLFPATIHGPREC